MPTSSDGFDPNRRTAYPARALALEKTNWALRIAKPPFYAHSAAGGSATGGITITLGGLKVNEAAQVIGNRLAADQGPVLLRRSAACSTTIIRPALAWCRVPHSGGSPGVTRRPWIDALKRRTSMREASSVSNADPTGITLLQNLAQRVLAFEKRQLTNKAIAQARACIIDTIGVTLAGHPEPCTQILLKTPGVATAPGPALIFGTARRTSALDATLINGTASHALDFDDFSGVMGGHHSVPLVSMLLALAEERGGTGENIIAAYVIGVEVEIRFARAVKFHHYDKGWHPTSTLGIFGTAAAACHLMKLDLARTTMALGIAASLAAGLKANFGTMTKPLHIGQCGRNGLLAALLAEGGFDAATDVLEHAQGFLNVFNGHGTFDIAKLFENWGPPWEIEASSIALKQFPCCGSTHPAITMALALRREEKIKAADIARIEVLPHGRRLRHTNTPHPQTSLEAKFSVQYVVARALVGGALRLKHFEGDAHFDPEIRWLLGLTTASPHPDMADDADEQWGAEVIVTLNDGRRLSRRVDNLVGRGGNNPMDSSELWDKFSDCAARSLPREQIAPLFERLETFEKVTEVAQITRLLEVSELHQAPTKEVVFAPRGAQEALETTWVP